MKPFVLALATNGLVDSISYMTVTPSLIFYVRSLGGSQDVYGFVLAIYSFAAFCAKPVLGRWSDAQNFTLPYLLSNSLSAVGGLVYAFAPAFSNPRHAIAAITMGRVLGGFGGANSTLGFAYVARALPAKERTSTTALLGGVQMIGMAIAPMFNYFLTSVNVDFAGVHFDRLNSVGLLLAFLNIISLVLIYILLPDLPIVGDSDHNQEDNKDNEWLRMFKIIAKNPHIGVPFLTIFTFNFNWQFIETGVAPAGHDALGWGPVEASYALGGMAILVFLNMTMVHQLSTRGISDFKLLSSGLAVNAIGCLGLYLLWYRHVNQWLFVAPILVTAGSFPFLGAPNRSMFSAAVDASPDLIGYEGTMQALLSMSASVGGFSAPGMIAHYCLRSPEEVDSSIDGREFTAIALLAPVLGALIFSATLLSGPIPEKPEKGDIVDEEIPGEDTPLVQAATTPKKHSDMTLRKIARRASVRGSITSVSAMTIIDPMDYSDEE